MGFARSRWLAGSWILWLRWPSIRAMRGMPGRTTYRIRRDVFWYAWPVYAAMEGGTRAAIIASLGEGSLRTARPPDVVHVDVLAIAAAAENTNRPVRLGHEKANGGFSYLTGAEATEDSEPRSPKIKQIAARMGWGDGEM